MGKCDESVTSKLFCCLKISNEDDDDDDDRSIYTLQASAKAAYLGLGKIQRCSYAALLVASHTSHSSKN